MASIKLDLPAEIHDDHQGALMNLVQMYGNCIKTTILTRAIGTNDSSELHKRSHDLVSFVGLEILKFQKLQEAHFSASITQRFYASKNWIGA